MFGNDDLGDSYLESWKEKRRLKKELSITGLDEEGKEAEKVTAGGIASGDVRRWSLSAEKTLDEILGQEKGPVGEQSELGRVYTKRGSSLRAWRPLSWQAQEDEEQQIQQQSSWRVASSPKNHDNKNAEYDNCNDAKDDALVNINKNNNVHRANQKDGDGHDSNDNSNSTSDRIHPYNQVKHQLSSSSTYLKQVPQTQIYGSGASEEKKEKEKVRETTDTEKMTEDKGRSRSSISGKKRWGESNNDSVSGWEERSQQDEGRSKHESGCEGMSERKGKGEKEIDSRIERKKWKEGVGEDNNAGMSSLTEWCAAGDNPQAFALCTDNKALLTAAAEDDATADNVDVKEKYSVVGSRVATRPLLQTVATTTTTATTITTSAVTKAAYLDAFLSKSSLKRTVVGAAASVAARNSTRPLNSSIFSSADIRSGSSRVFQQFQKPPSSVQTLDPLAVSPVSRSTSPSKLLEEDPLLPTVITSTATPPTSLSNIFSSSLPSFLSSSTSSSLSRPLRVTTPASRFLPPALKPRTGLSNSEPEQKINSEIVPNPSQSREVTISKARDISQEVISKIQNQKHNDQPQHQQQPQHQPSTLTNTEIDSKETRTKTEPAIDIDSGLDTGIKPGTNFRLNSDNIQTDLDHSNDHHGEHNIFPDNISTSPLKILDEDLELDFSGSDLSYSMKQVSNDKEMSQPDFSEIKVTETLNNETARHKLLLRRKSSLAQRQRPRRARRRVSDSGSDSDTNRGNISDTTNDYLSLSSSPIKSFDETETFDISSSTEQPPEKITDYLPKVSKHVDPGLQLKREKDLENQAVFGIQPSVCSRNLYNDIDNSIEETSSKTEKLLTPNRIAEALEPLRQSKQSSEPLSPLSLTSPVLSSTPVPSPGSTTLPESVDYHESHKNYRYSYLPKEVKTNNTDNSLEETVDKNWQNSLNELNKKISRNTNTNKNSVEHHRPPNILRTISSAERQIYKNLIGTEESNEKESSNTDEPSVNDNSEDILIEDYKKRKSVSENNYSFDVKSVLCKVPENAKENSPKNDNNFLSKEPSFKRNIEARRVTSFVHLDKRTDNKVQKDPAWFKDFRSSSKRVGRILSNFDCVKSPTEKECEKEQSLKTQDPYPSLRQTITGGENKQSTSFNSSSILPHDTNKSSPLSETKTSVTHQDECRPSSSFSSSQRIIDDNKTGIKRNDTWSTTSKYRHQTQEPVLDTRTQLRKSSSSISSKPPSVSSISYSVPDWKKRLAEQNKIKRESFQKVEDISSNKTHIESSTAQPAWRQSLVNKGRNSQSIEQSEKTSEKPEWIRKAEERRARLSQNSLLKN